MKKIVNYFLLFCLLGIFIEGISFLGVLYLESKMLIYSPREVSASAYGRYLEKRDPVLGWPPPKDFGGPQYDESGARRSPALSNIPGSKPYLSTYGDSFTFGDGLGDAFAYPNILAGLMGKKVSNFGVSGYGTDQAYLRFLNNPGDPAEIVILGHASEDIVRNVNRYGDFRWPPPQQNYSFKPRFVFSQDGSLTLIPLPSLSYEEFKRVLRSPQEMRDEYFIPGRCPEIGVCRFPFTATLLKTVLGKPSFAVRLRNAYYQAFYEPHHPSRALAVTFAIIKKFRADALAAGKRPLVFMIPELPDFEVYQKNKTWPYANLVSLMREDGIAFIDAGPAIIRRLKGKDFRELFLPTGHYNEDGNQLLAEIVRDHLSQSAQA